MSCQHSDSHLLLTLYRLYTLLLRSINHDLQCPKMRFHFPSELPASPPAVHPEAAPAVPAQILKVVPSSNHDQVISGPLKHETTLNRYVKLLPSCARSVASTIPSLNGNWYQEIWCAICKFTYPSPIGAD